MKEATARIKINKLLEAADWRFLTSAALPPTFASNPASRLGRQITARSPLTTQQTIVAEIKAEQALIAANRDLIECFEKKIQTTLARVWGEDTHENSGMHCGGDNSQ